MSLKTAFFAEDEPLARDLLRDAIYANPGLRLVCEAANGAEALERITRLRPEVVFMDIQMPEMTGLDVLRRLDYLPQIVFTTAYDQYAVTAFELHAVDYLLKPFTQARFVRIHRSALVNLDFVDSMRADEQSQLQIQMRDGTVLGANRDASKVLRDMAI
ncbi:LytR/AlgR family response regulator transcription factor [Massilia varians]|nr:response regulator transcription factor [Massilia varians]